MGRRRSRGFLVVGILLAAFNLRPALAGVSPLLGDIARDLRLTPTTGASSLPSPCCVLASVRRRLPRWYGAGDWSGLCC
jgi:cyanate permease